MFVNVVSVNDVSGPPSGVGPASWFGIRINHTWSDVKSPVYLISESIFHNVLGKSACLDVLPVMGVR